MTDVTQLQLAQLPSLASAYGRALVTRKAGLRPGQRVGRIEARLHDYRVDAELLDRYCRVCGLASDGLLPITYPQVLANAICAEMILDPSFPFAPVGMIHRSNSFEALRAIDVDEPLDFVCAIEGHRESDLGVEVDFATEVVADGEPAWRGVATMLVRTPGTRRPGRAASPRGEAEVGDAGLRIRSTTWTLRADAGRRYAAVSGDYNPIHLWPLTAKLFGFKGAIVHGLWEAARAVAELDDDLPAMPVRLAVSFKRPVVLPTTLLFSAGRSDDDSIELAVRSRDGSKPHMLGTVRQLNSA